MTNISNATAGGGSDAQSVVLYTLQIMDDDDLPVVNFTDGTGYTDAGDTESTIAENESSITINVQLSRATERTVTIPFTFTDYGTINNGAQGAAATGDYPIDWYYSSSTNAAGGTADWSTGASFDAAGSVTIVGNGKTDDSGTKATFAISVQSDAIDEWDETFVINLGTPTNGQKGTAEAHTVTITDVSSPPVIEFSSLLVDDGTAEATQAANDFNLNTIIGLTPQSGRNLQFTYKTEVVGTGATATAGQD